MNNDVVISVNKVSKQFKLPHENSNSIKNFFTSVFRLKSHNTFETQVALEDISFEIKRGEFFGIVGRNGSGKSTLLKLLAGIYQPSGGNVKIDGRLVPFIELGVGFNPELTGRENLYLNGALLNFSEKEVSAMYDDIVEFAELGRFMDQKLKNYSSGMQVRLAFSMAIRADADILLIDEVLAVGDVAFQRKCFDYFRTLRKNKKTVVFISHDMSAIREYCDRAILINDGELQAEGNSEVIAKKYSKLFIDSDSAVNNNRHDTNSKRFGDYAVGITKVNVDKKEYLYDSDRTIKITAEVKAREDLENTVSAGFMVSNAAGEPIFGTNTDIEGSFVGILKAGQTKKIVWEIPNIFNDGTYYIDIAITSMNGIVVHDWWSASRSFRVSKERSTPYIVAPRVKTTFKKI